MAILFGGQMIKKMVTKTMSLPPDEGVNVFKVDVANRGTFRKEFKEAVNTIELDPETRHQVVQEAIQVFQRNNRLVSSISIPRQVAYQYFFYGALILLILAVVRTHSSWISNTSAGSIQVGRSIVVFAFFLRH